MTLNCKGSDIKYFGGYVCVPCHSPGDTLGELVADKEYTVTVKRKVNKRSNAANAYMWVLCDKLAEALSTDGGEFYTKVDIYREHIKAVGVWKDYPPMNEQEAKGFMYAWSCVGPGWVTELGYANDGENRIVRAYYGSSTYSTRRMARLIDSLTQDCKALGIETRPEEEVRSLLAQWKEEKNAAGSADEQTSGSTGTTYSEGH